MTSNSRHLILLNCSLFTLSAGIMLATLTDASPQSVPLGELEHLTAGVGAGNSLATNPGANNKCYYCVNVGPPANGSIECTDIAQVLGTGTRNYQLAQNVPCSPETRWSRPGCVGLGGRIGGNCTTTKTVYTDP